MVERRTKLNDDNAFDKGEDCKYKKTCLQRLHTLLLDH